jgi:hypothetical protein
MWKTLGGFWAQMALFAYILPRGTDQIHCGAAGLALFRRPYNKARLEQFGEVLQAWMISQILGGPTDLDQLVCDSKTLKGSAIET